MANICASDRYDDERKETLNKRNIHVLFEGVCSHYSYDRIHVSIALHCELRAARAKTSAAPAGGVERRTMAAVFVDSNHAAIFNRSIC